MTTIAIVQARLGSTRLPGKVLMPINGTPMLGVLLGRLRRARLVDEIVVATSDNPKDDALAAFVAGEGLACVRGSEKDVLSRFHKAATAAKADVVVRITGDCPLIDPDVVDAVIVLRAKSGADYASNIQPPLFPDGLDTEVFTMQALEMAQAHAVEAFDREHVTPYLRNQPQFQRSALQGEGDFSNLRWTVDEQADMDVVRRVFAAFPDPLKFGWRQVLALYDTQPEIFNANTDLKRNEGATMGTGQKLWKRAKQVIPGGNMLLSKRPEMFLPEQWPAYFSRTEGCKVWDLDDNLYHDLSLMGIGTNTLGYNCPEVDAAVRAVVDKGNMSTLNCPEEVELAEKLVELHPWADMVRFARTGGEANAVGVRIARAAAGRDKIAICGYHGWHDWYLAANLSDQKHLDGHLLPGLDPNGVPRHLAGSVLPFNYNDTAALEAVTSDPDVGVVIMEVARNFDPADQFLHRVRELTTQRGIVLFFDECTSGFRQTYGGLHKQFGVEPDMASFGKTLGNGYAITAIVGRRDIMDAAQTSFISSSFWTERIGPAAALATLKVMERERSWEVITKTGQGIRSRWQALADSVGLKINHWGLPALAGYTFASDKALAYKTLITQEMLGKGFLAGTSIYSSLAHTPEIVDRYFDALEPIFKTIKACEEGQDVMALLKGPVCHGGFRRLN